MIRLHGPHTNYMKQETGLTDMTWMIGLRLKKVMGNHERHAPVALMETAGL